MGVGNCLSFPEKMGSHELRPTVTHKCHVNIFLSSLTKHFSCNKLSFRNTCYYFVVMTNPFLRANLHVKKFKINDFFKFYKHVRQ